MLTHIITNTSARVNGIEIDNLVKYTNKIAIMAESDYVLKHIFKFDALFPYYLTLSLQLIC